MIELSMYFGIGLLFGALIGLVLISLIHARAVRFTTRRLEAALPEIYKPKRICCALNLRCQHGALR